MFNLHFIIEGRWERNHSSFYLTKEGIHSPVEGWQLLYKENTPKSTGLKAWETQLEYAFLFPSQNEAQKIQQNMGGDAQIVPVVLRQVKKENKIHCTIRKYKNQTWQSLLKGFNTQSFYYVEYGSEQSNFKPIGKLKTLPGGQQNIFSWIRSYPSNILPFPLSFLSKKVNFSKLN